MGQNRKYDYIVLLNKIIDDSNKKAAKMTESISDESVEYFKNYIGTLQLDNKQLARLEMAVNEYVEDNSYSNATAFIIGYITTIVSIASVIMSGVLSKDITTITGISVLSVLIIILVVATVYYLATIKENRRKGYVISNVIEELLSKKEKS